MIGKDLPTGIVTFLFSDIEEALRIYREVGDERQIADAVLNLAYMPALRGDLAASRRMYEEAIQLFDELGATEQAGYARSLVGYALMMEGDTEGLDRSWNRTWSRSKSRETHLSLPAPTT
jgi:hypothetical protein